MRKILTPLILAAVLAASAAAAEEAAMRDDEVPSFDSSHAAYSGQLLPPVIAAGMDVYAMEGAERAIETWVKGGPLEGDEKIAGMATVFQDVEARYGKYRGYRSIGQSTISPESKIVYVQMNFEKGPLFLRFLCYLAGEKWVVAGRFLGNTDPGEVLRNIELDKIASS